MASCTLRDMLVTIGDTETVFNVHFLADPDVVHNSSRFALSSLWIPNQVIPGTEHPPAEGEVLVRSAGEVQTGVLCHSAIGKESYQMLIRNSISQFIFSSWCCFPSELILQQWQEDVSGPRGRGGGYLW